MPASNVVNLFTRIHDVFCTCIMPADAPKVAPEANSSSSSSSSTTAPAAAAAETTMSPKELEEATKNLTARVCGSPAVDGYAHVVIECLGVSVPGSFGDCWLRCLRVLVSRGFGAW